MLTTQVIQACIEDLRNVTKIGMVVVDLEGYVIAKTTQDIVVEASKIKFFISSGADSQSAFGLQYMKVSEDGDTVYVIVSRDRQEDEMIAKIAAHHLQNLLHAYKERFDKNNFFQNLILDNLLLVDIYNRAKKLRIENEVHRVVYVIEAKFDKDNGALEMLKSLFFSQSGDYVTAVDEQSIILIKRFEENASHKDFSAIADTIVGMMNTEAMLKVNVAYGGMIKELKDVSKSYKEAKMALDVGKIFYADKEVIAYNSLGIGRLIYQLPINLCKMFIDEIFGNGILEALDEETLITVNMFLENNLNVSETARQLFVHRNTLLYRLEKLQRATGLDIRIFEDALTLKIALMVVSYRNYLELQSY